MNPLKPPLRLAILLSGTGRTLENIFERIQSGQLDAKVEIVIGSSHSALGLERARKRQVDTRVIKPKAFQDSEEFSAAITEVLNEFKIDLVVLAGFLYLYKIPEIYKNRVINIHPGLIPAFCGKGMYGHHVHEAVLAYGAKISGLTVHFADNEYDRGPVILQRSVPVLEGDTSESLANRVFEQEKEAYPEAIQLFAEGRLRVEDRIVHVLAPDADRENS